jgi:hypothetical protein
VGSSSLLYGLGDKADAEYLLKRMIDDPASDGELMFATDFYARKFGGRRTGSCTELLRAGVTLTVDDAYRGNPEAGVAGVMRRKGYQVFFAENIVWHCLFGLLFWDELFESDLLNSSFDWMPHCLKDRSFARRFAAQIEVKLDAIQSGDAFNLLLRPIATHWGRPSGIFAWDHVDVDALRLLLSADIGEGIAMVVRSMCRDFRDMRDGFPDLMLAKDGAVTFMEIKAEGDVIRRNQLTRLSRSAAGRTRLRPSHPPASSCLARQSAARYGPLVRHRHRPLDHPRAPRGAAGLGIVFLGKSKKTLPGELVGLLGQIAGAQCLLPVKFAIHEIPPTQQ